MSSFVKTVRDTADNLMFSDMRREHWGGSDFFNVGYWREDTQSQGEASENLLDELLALLPDKTGTILDVACGMGATTRHLLKHYPADRVTAINISAKQLEEAQRKAPGCTFLEMDAAVLEFEDDHFDNILCVEAAFHFHTRERFLREALRVLAPGGRLIMADQLNPHWVSRWSPRVPDENFLPDIPAYRDLCERVGFQNVEILDVTDETWRPFCREILRGGWKSLARLDLSYAAFLLLARAMAVGLRGYVLVSVQK
jgi:MPBQ/MSBQ methyltransferase